MLEKTTEKPQLLEMYDVKRFKASTLVLPGTIAELRHYKITSAFCRLPFTVVLPLLQNKK